jgi:hypothetical protein
MKKRAPALTAILTMTSLLTTPGTTAATTGCGGLPKFRTVTTTATIAEVVVRRGCRAGRGCVHLEVVDRSVHRTAVFVVADPAATCRPDDDS